MTTKADILIVGGGWAGLSSAIRLKKKGYRVQLFEASRQLGGRARCIKYKGLTLDNGQHILTGSCFEVLDLFKLLEMNEADYLCRQSLLLKLLDISGNQQNLQISAANLPAPLHLLFALFQAQGLKFKEKYFLIQLFINLHLKSYQLKEDGPLLAFLQQQQQSSITIAHFWQPLCLAIMNTPINIASTQIFLHVLKASFAGKKHDSDILLFKRPLCEILAKNASTYIQKDNSKINLNTKVISLKVENNELIGITTADKLIECNQIILATPMHITAKLLAPFCNCKQLVTALKKIDYQPIYTIYLYFQKKFTLKNNLTGILNGHSQWVFDKSLSQQQGLLSVVISGSGEHQQLDKESLIQKINSEVQKLFKLPPLDWGIVVKEKKATINCSVENNALRPTNHSPIKGLYLAGDYTNNLYPSTLEGAVLSGRTAADIMGPIKLLYNV